jgi:hypothetical protein
MSDSVPNQPDLGKIPTYSDTPMPGRCGAKRKQGPGYCTRAAAGPSGRCHWHGGKTPYGPACPNWKHGDRSKYMPRDLAKRYEAARKDPELLSIASDVALLETRMRQRLEALQTGQTATLWAELQECLISAIDAFRVGQTGPLGEQLGRMAEIVRTVRGEEQTWQELRELAEERSRIAVREWKRIETVGAILTAQDALILIRAVIDSVRRHCTDTKQQAAIGLDLINMVHGIRQRQSVKAGVEDGATQ